jgi:hypothetical protein
MKVPNDWKKNRDYLKKEDKMKTYKKQEKTFVIITKEEDWLKLKIIKDYFKNPKITIDDIQDSDHVHPTY